MVVDRLCVEDKPVLFCLMHRLHLGQNVDLDCEVFQSFGTVERFHYNPLCDDFGPMNISCVLRFCQLLEKKIEANTSKGIVYMVETGRRALTNGAFLLGAYLVLHRLKSPEEAWTLFQELDPDIFEPFRDATFSKSSFDLTLLDCWRSLKRAYTLSWVEPTENASVQYGMIDLEEYEHYEDPLNGDLVQVIPNRYIAFRGPFDLGTDEYRDEDGFRRFSPNYFVDIFLHLNVRVVIRLNECCYDPEPFTSRGIQHFDLEFEDCTAPPAHVITEFFRIVDSTDGLVAVHCKAGLGRTGTLIALDLMRLHGFSAREAMAWVRIMRPGSIIGEQQHFLVDREATATVPLSRIRTPASSLQPQAAAAAEPCGPLAEALAGADDGPPTLPAEVHATRRTAATVERALQASEVAEAVARRASAARGVRRGASVHALRVAPIHAAVRTSSAPSAGPSTLPALSISRAPVTPTPVTAASPSAPSVELTVGEEAAVASHHRRHRRRSTSCVESTTGTAATAHCGAWEGPPEAAFAAGRDSAAGIVLATGVKSARRRAGSVTYSPAMSWV